jgi:hypothetical protein
MFDKWVKSPFIKNYDMSLENVFQRLQLCILEFLNLNSYEKIMSPQNRRIHNLAILRFPFESFGNLWHLIVVPIITYKIYYRE